MCFKTRQIPDISFDSANLTPPTMSELVGATVQARRVKCIEITYASIIALVGVALVAFTVAMFIVTAKAHGLTLSMTPLFALLGVVSITGTVLSIVAIKRMVDTCRSWSQLERDIEEVT